MASPVVGPTISGGTPVPNAPVILGGIGADGKVYSLAVGSDGSLDFSSAVSGVGFYANAALKATKVAVKASAASIYGWHIYNLDNTVTYVQFFNKLTAGVTVGATTPDFVLVVPASGWLDDPPALPPIAFDTGLVIAATTTYAGSTAQANGLVFNLWYA